MKDMLKVLIVTENDSLRDDLSGMIHQAGHIAMTTNSCPGGMDRIREEKPHMVVLDNALREMNGVEICRQLRREAGHDAAYLVLISDFGEKKQLKSEALDFGADGFIISPVRKEDLVAHLNVASRMMRIETDRKERAASEAAFRTSNTYNRSLIEANLDPLVTIDHNGKISDANKAAEDLTGIVRHDLIGSSFSVYFTEPDKAESIYRAAFRDGWIRDRELMLRRLDGTISPVICNVSIYKDDNGNVLGVLASAKDITVLKRAEGARLESEKQYRVVADNTYDWEFWIRPDRTFIYTSPSCERVTGYGASEFEKDPGLFLRIVHPDDLSLVSNHLETDKTHIDSPEEMAFRILHRDGSVRWIGHLCQPVFDENGVFIGTRGSNRDISERKQSQEALAVSEIRFRELFNRMSSGVAVYEARGNGDDFIIKDVNLACERLSRVKRGIIVGRSVGDVFPGVTDMGLFDVFQRVWRTGMPEHHPVVMYQDDRITQWVENEVYKLPTGEIVAIFDDMTEHKCADAALQESEEIYRILAEKSLVGLYIVQEGKYAYANTNIAQITGYNPQELLGKDAYTLVHPDDRVFVTARTRKMLKGEDTAPYEFRIIRKDHEVRWVMEKVAPIPFKGKPAIIGSSMDITEQKLVEEERQHLEDRLRQAQKMEAIGTLAGGIAHDFNNILGAVSGFTELAMEKVPDDGKVRNYLKQIFGATRRATDLVTQILEFSRQKERELRPIKMTPVIKEVVKLLRATIPSTIEIRLELDADPDMIMGDVSQIHQLMMNLCTNAYHAMRDQGGVLGIRLAESDIATETVEHPGLKPGRYLNLSVSDTGHGISPEYLDRIFDPFFTTKKIGEGTGLGLSVVHGIVKSLHGFISVGSRTGKGTDFNIRLPLLPEGSVLETGEPEADAIHGEGKILVVDDEPGLSEMIRDMLQGLGYQVTAMTSSMEALRAFSADPGKFDLVITDQTMPDMTGLAFAREILKIKPGVPIILCTGYSHIIDPELAKAAGIKEFVMKPIIRRKIAASIQRLLKDSHEDS